MKKIIYVIGGIVALGLISLAWYAFSPLLFTVEVNEVAPESASNQDTEITSEATLPAEEKVSTVVGTSGHPASGVVRLIETEAGTVLRYEDFKTINGPDLFVYLAKDLEANDFVNLGDLKGTEGNANYSVPKGVDIKDYKYAMVWCKQFGVLFNYADLSDLR